MEYVLLYYIRFRFGNPISVGIYGQAAYETSNYIFEVVKQSPGDYTSYVRITDKVPEVELYEHEPQINPDNSYEQKNDAKVKSKKKTDNVSSKINGIFSLLEVFQLIFL